MVKGIKSVKSREWLIVTTLFLSHYLPVKSSETRYVTLSTVKARAMAMGGAFMAMKNELASLDFNPAGFSISRLSRRSQVSIYVNPLGPLIIKENWRKTSDWETLVGWIFRGVGFTYENLSFGVLFGEESLTDEERFERNCFFDGTGYEVHRNTSFGFSIDLAARVSLGIAGEAFIREENEKKRWSWGYRYGLILKPKNTLTVGLCFFDFPNRYQDDRMVLERLADETLNIGICYSPWQAFSLALDIRNVSDEAKGAAREPHIGFELTPFKEFSFRGGYYRERGGDSHTFSLGVGFLKSYTSPSHDRFIFNPTLGFNASLLWEKNVSGENRWLFFSCILRI